MIGSLLYTTEGFIIYIWVQECINAIGGSITYICMYICIHVVEEETLLYTIGNLIVYSSRPYHKQHDAFLYQ